MFKPPSRIAEDSQFDNLAVADLADMHGQLGAKIAVLEACREAIATELIAHGVRPVASGPAESDLFGAGVARETMVAILDREAIERDMGEAWLARYLRWSNVAPRYAQRRGLRGSPTRQRRSDGARRTGPPGLAVRRRIGRKMRGSQARLGWRSRCGVAFSNASAARSTVASWNGLPTSWIATGRPPAPNPEHTDIAG
jgi:hypothetical protein